MAKKTKKQESEVLVDVEQSLSRVEAFFEDNQKAITGFIAAIIIGVGGYYAFTRMYLAPREKEAQYELYLSQQHLDFEDFEQALNGDGNSIGLIAISENYSMTKAANLANYYAGVSYLNTADYKNAIKYLDKFSTKDDILSVVSTGAIADAFIELNQTKEALEYYEKAIKKSSNSLVVPIYIKKAGQTAMLLEDNKRALKHFKNLMENYSQSEEAQNADKIIAKLEAKQ
jgi:tetratricopeptide (TPR) repeat protein